MLTPYPPAYGTLTGDDSKKAFASLKEQIQWIDGFKLPKGFGIGIGTYAKNTDGTRGQLLDLDFEFGVNHASDGDKYGAGTAAILANVLGHLGGTKVFDDVTLEQLEVMLFGFGQQYLSEPRENHANIAAIESAINTVYGAVDVNSPEGKRWLPQDPRFNRVYGVVICFIDDNDDPAYKVFADDDTEKETNLVPNLTQADYLFRLYLLSYLKVDINGINLDGIFKGLPSLVRTNFGSMLPGYVAKNRLLLRRSGVVSNGTDRFPRYVDCIEPDVMGVRIADAARVRLGAHLAPGTTVMHEGFVNYNAGTLGASMVEGRISQGVVVGEGSDVGGGASIMGTLSGGGTEKVVVGAGALLGANSGIGISIGDNSVVEAGLYLTAGTIVNLYRQASSAHRNGHEKPTPIKAVELSGVPGLLFRRNSQTGAVEAFPRTGAGVVLNTDLHANTMTATAA